MIIGARENVTQAGGRRPILRAGVVLAVLMAVLLGVGSGRAVMAAPGAAPGAGAGTTAAAPGGTAPRGTAAETVTVGDLKSLLSTLGNESERKKLAAQLRALIAAKQATAPPAATLGARTLGAVSAWVDAASGKIVRVAGAVLDAPSLLRWAGRQISKPEVRAQGLKVIVKLVIILGLGVIAAWLVRVVVRRPRGAVEAWPVKTVAMRWVLLLARTGLDLTPILGFAAISYGVLPFTEPGVVTRAAALVLVNAIVLAQVILVAARAVLAPQATALRLISMSDESAHYTMLWMRRLTNTAIYGYFAAEGGLLLGLPAGGHTTLLNLLGLVIGVMLIMLILQNRALVAEWIGGQRHDQPGKGKGRLQTLRRRLADVWHILAILYVVAIFVVWALGIEGGFTFVLTASVLTVVILGAARLVIEMSVRAVDRGFAVSEDLKRRFPTLEARANRYVPLLNGAIAAVINVFTALALLQVWGIDVVAWATSDLGRRLLGTGISIAFVLLVALAVWEAAGLYIERYLAKLDSDRVSVGRRGRARTLLPLFRNVLLVALVVIVGLIVLAQLSIDITPLLAGAGVVGLAVGLGSQKLIQDLINGFSLVLQDTMAVGDVVSLGDNGGVVEAISLRNVRLRDLAGNVHTIPLGEVGIILNRTRDFSYYVFDVGVAYKEDIDHVIKVLQDLGAELQADAAFAPNILEPLEVLGLDRFEDSAVIVKVRIKTLPIKQWMIGREFNRRMKKRFDELGIEIPFPHRTIFFGEEKAAEIERFAAMRPTATASEDGGAAEAGGGGEAGGAANGEGG